ncbi:hygromycin-B 7''-O-kinase [Faunimonas pinastri]|uniref:Hygromycin-B 7''-O-kinase n=1 Tax=Faunimonas pinastri TaxID=1855383 RepID=A0A1H9NC10_9HYPH|nr:aminoglycoside phosphotransferase family protein [Faunimonas pinastri]SER33351.1 hygromycin-B 7''-O-kinase [Faunimonas pinastri]
MIELPRIANKTDFARWRADPRRWSSTVGEIARLANVPARAFSAFETGTNLVVDLDGKSVLKLFPPMFRSQFVSERATLRQLDGKLSVAIPRMVAEGEHDGWCWLVMTKLDGIAGSEVWSAVPEEEKELILQEIGQAIAEVQSVPLGDLASVEPAWPDFIEPQVAGWLDRHRSQGLPPRFLSDLRELLSDVPSVVPLDQPGVILTGEWIPENFLLSEDGGRWKLAAVIDFGDVMVGWREYDLLGPSAFMCAGLPGRVRSLLRGYGMAPHESDAALRRRLLTLMVLHRASDLRNVAIDGWQDRVQSLFDLEDLVWPSLD